MAHTFITCSFCGKREDLEVYRVVNSPLVSKMRTELLCFECAYWLRWLKNPEPNTLVIDGQLWASVVPFEKPSLHRSRANEYKFVIDINTQEVFGSAALTLKGNIPERFAAQLPNQYKFITRDEYLRMNGYNAEMCLSKGCFDRYHCIWYNAAIAEPDEPWNNIPKNYKIGSEDCPSFVNKDVLYNN